MQYQLTLVAIISISLASCGGGSGGSDNSIPTIKVECASSAVADCSASSKLVFVGLIENLAMDCDNTLHGLNASQRQLLFTVTGQAVSSRNGIYLVATVDSFTNSTGGQQDVLNPGAYRVCSFVDIDGNGVLDSGEPVGSGQADTGAGYYILNSWAAGI